MQSKLSHLLLALLCLSGGHVLAQCPQRIDNYTSGSASSTSCPGVSGNAIATNFTGTSYATVPGGTKAGNFEVRWDIPGPSPIPAIKAFYSDSAQLAVTAGPASPININGSNYKASYCFYGSVNLPTGKKYSLIFVNPQTNALLYTCSFASDVAISQPTVTTQPQSKSVCIGSSATFTVAATAAAGTVTYRWQKNGVNIAGATGTSLTINPVTAADTGTNIYRALIVQSDGAIQISNEVSLTPANPAIWTGSTNSDWKTPGNWSPAVVPDSTKHVYVGNATNKPTIAASDTGKCKCLTLDNGYVSVTGRVEIAGPIYLLSGGYMKATNGAVALNGTSGAQTLPANTFETNTVKDLAFGNAAGVTLAGPTNFTGELRRFSGTLTTGGFLTLKSTSTGTARVAECVAGSISGDVTVERYIPTMPGNLRTWRLLAPVTSGSQTIRDAWQEGATSINSNPNPGYGTIITCNSSYSTTNGFDAVMPSSSILTWDVSNQSLNTSPVTNTNTKALSSERAYFLFIRGDRSVLPGSSTNGATTTTLRSKGTLAQGDQPTITVQENKLMVLGNPYPSAIDFSLMSASDRVNMGNRFWLWDPRSNGSYGTGAYVLFDNASGFTPSITGGCYSGPNSTIPMGMGFFVMATGGTGSLTLREAHKTDGASNNGFKPAVNSDKLHIQLSYLKNGTTLSPADGAFILFDNSYAKGVDDNDAQKPVNAGENLAIVSDDNTLALEARPGVSENDTVALKMWKLRANDVYRFTITPSFNTTNVKARLIDRYLQTEQWFSMVLPTNVDFRINADSASFAPDRFYIALSAAPVSVKDPVVNDVTIYPNPTNAQNINISMPNAAAGNYNFRIVDIQGRIVYNETYQHVGHSLVKKLQAGVLAPGNYFIAISKDGVELSTRKLTINQ
ncbi:T9SS type A sorting domain-containing protein [Polluticoccus soli]|uniref:T9SS type A sorting domain-containing protein n=1 Tax=Polluticoccus soli TaxID=3034150 RepID=UPI0023E2F38A|nr:T9SS type A sorting domain-containing protein [Flavipsychrobacter sp. JY13-12]